MYGFVSDDYCFSAPTSASIDIDQMLMNLRMNGDIQFDNVEQNSHSNNYYNMGETSQSMGEC